MKNNTQDNSVNDELERLFSDSKKKSRRVKKEKPSSPSKKAGSPDGKKGEEKKKNQKKSKKKPIAIYNPDLQHGFPFSTVLGVFFRFFAVALSLFGLIWLFADAIALNAPYLFDIRTNISWFPVFLFCLYSISAFSLVFMGRKTALFGLPMAFLPITVAAVVYGNPFAYASSGLYMIQKCTVSRLTHASYAAKELIPFPDEGFFYLENATSTELCYAGILVIVFVFSIFFALMSAKRMRLLPMILLGSAVCMFCFTYNLCRTNVGITCIIIGLASAIVLSSYDKIYKDVSGSYKGRAYSGYASALAGVLAMAILFIFTSSVTGAFAKIDVIQEPMESLRNYIMTVLTGGNPKNNVMNSYNKKVSTELKDISFTDDLLFTVSSYSDRNVYLRAWIGDDFSFSKDEWSILSDKEYNEFSLLLKEESLGKYVQNGYTSDAITYLIRSLFDEDLSKVSPSSAHRLKNGYITSFVDIDYVENTGNMMVLPSSFLKNLGIFAYKSRRNAYSGSFDYYSDGMAKSAWHNVYKEYSAAAMIPRYSVSNYGMIAENQGIFYSILSEFLETNYKRWHRSTIKDEEILAMKEELSALLKTHSLNEKRITILEKFLSLSYSDRTKWYDTYIRVTGVYSDYVNDTYLDFPENSKGIDTVYNAIKKDLDAASDTHSKIMVIVKYLCQNYAYTETPKELFELKCKEDKVNPSSVKLYDSDIDNFLLVYKCGYCVHFATAATLLARRAGIPARYVQGYMASDFKINPENKEQYVSTVYGRDAHAWFEVYTEGTGWSTYEPTLIYYEDIYYVPKESLPGHRDPTSSEIRDWWKEQMKTSVAVTTVAPVEETTNPEEETDYTASYTIEVFTLVAALIVLVIFAIFVFVKIKKANNYTSARFKIINDAIYKHYEDESEMRKTAAFVSDTIMEVLKISGRSPLDGEAPEDFARRVDENFSPKTKSELKIVKTRLANPHTLSEIIIHIESEEFGNGMTRDGLFICGEYLEYLIRSEYRLMNPFKRFWYRYVRRKI